MRLFLLIKNNGFAKGLGYVFALEYPVHNIHVLQHLLCKTNCYMHLWTTYMLFPCSHHTVGERQTELHTSVCTDTWPFVSSVPKQSRKQTL